jgi:hypothetical protein
MSTISGYGDSTAYYDYEPPSDPPPGSDNPVENAGPLPPPPQNTAPQGDTSYKDWSNGVQGVITGAVTRGDFVDNTVLLDI